MAVHSLISLGETERILMEHLLELGVAIERGVELIRFETPSLPPPASPTSRGGLTHYARKYPDGWATEVLFLVPTEGRRASTEAALAGVANGAASRLTFRVCTLEKAVAYVQGLLPPTPELPTLVLATDAPLFGPEEHRTVNDFGVESTTALAQANAALRRHGAAEVLVPPSTAQMLAFLKRAQAR
jgi:hypothetical protein